MNDSIFDVDSVKQEIDRDKVIEQAQASGDYGPIYGSEDWAEFVMSQFQKGEVFENDGLTTVSCAGLRRVAQKLLGNIIVSEPSHVFPATGDGAGRATVAWRVVIDWMGTGKHRTFGDVAGVWYGNTDPMFADYPEATAATRAEGRALRKALGVKCVSSEEIPRNRAQVKELKDQRMAAKQGKETEGEWEGGASISDYQTNFIMSKCRQLDMSVYDFVNLDKLDKKPISKLTKAEAAEALKSLNHLQQNPLEIPRDKVQYFNTEEHN
jgi:hypothetical protein